jgi:hypothetical protein
MQIEIDALLIETLFRSKLYFCFADTNPKIDWPLA